MDGLDVGRGPQGELELNGGHDESNVDTKKLKFKKVVGAKDQEYRIELEQPKTTGVLDCQS